MFVTLLNYFNNKTLFMTRSKHLLALGTAFIMLSSFSNRPLTGPENAETKANEVALMIANAAGDGNIDFKELKTIVAELKGSKLTGAEKVALKLNRKKISENLQAASASGTASGGKSQLTAVLLCFFLGSLGVHRFYLGYTWQGIVQLLTLGGLGIWTIIDFIRILTGSLQPKHSEYEKTL